MLRSRGVFLLVLLSCYRTISANVIVDSSSYSGYWTLPEDGPRTFVQGTLFNTDVNTFPYAVCEFTKPKVEKTCNVTLDRRHKPNHGTCRIKVFADEDKELFLNGYFQLIPFADDHIAVVWWDRTKNSLNVSKDNTDKNFKVSILNANNCKSYNLNFSIDKVAFGFFPALVMYDNQIDVIVNSKKSCNGVDQCRLSFDLQGKQIDGVQSYKPKLSGYASPVNPTSPAKGFFQYVKDLSSIRVLFVDGSGDGKEVMNVKFEEQKVAKHDAYSNAYELYTLCWTPSIATQNPTVIQCSQFDATGKLKINTTTVFPKLLNWSAVHNLPKGGFLLATGGCEKADSNECKAFQVNKINKSGDDIKQYTFYIRGQAPAQVCRDITSNLEVRISENDKDEFCFEFSCLDSATKLMFTSQCVNKAKFN